MDQAPDGYKEIIRLIEEQHEYLKIAKLEQAFTEAIFKVRRRQGQTISGFVATKKAGFAEVKKQGLDLLATEAGEHLLGHLVLRQGGFSADQQQRIRVPSDGSIQFKRIEVRKIFGMAWTRRLLAGCTGVEEMMSGIRMAIPTTSYDQTCLLPE